jgi:methionyl-tRNA formyltransferase
MRLVFYLMNKKGFVALKEFLEIFGSSCVEYIVTSQDKNVEKDYFLEIIELCKESNITVFNRTEQLPLFEGYKIAIGWRWIITDTANLIVMHDSLLPKYRGFSPLVNMLINGEKELGVTALFASDKYDEGDIILQASVEIEYPIKIREAIRLVSSLYSKLLISIFQQLLDKGELLTTSQDHNIATYSLWRDEADYFIDWSMPASKIIRTIDALSFPFSGAKTYLNGQLVTIYEGVEEKDVSIENRDTGKVIFLSHGCPVVVCGEGLIKITNAVDENNLSVLPLRKFRSRFEGK